MLYSPHTLFGGLARLTGAPALGINGTVLRPSPYWQTLAGRIAPKPGGRGLPVNSRLPLGKPEYALPITVACTRFPNDPAGVAKVHILYDRSPAYILF
jgi:hypothetical protein